MKWGREDTSDSLLYVNDLGARESAATLRELEIKTERMIKKLYKVMRDSRLAVNSDKTQIMCLRSNRKRKAMAKKGEGRKMEMVVEGHKLVEMEHGTVLGLTWNSDLTWKKNTEMMLKKFNKKFYGCSRVRRYLPEKRQKELAEGILISQIRYGIEITTGGLDREVTAMQRMQSRAARMVLGRKRKNWSYTEGLKDLRWLSVPQMAVEATIKGALKVLRAKKNRKLI